MNSRQPTADSRQKPSKREYRLWASSGLWAVGCWLLLACGSPQKPPDNGDTNGPLPNGKKEEPREQVLKDTRPEDSPADAKLRKALLAGGAGADDIRKMSTSRNLNNIDALGRFINDMNQSYERRVDALAALRSLIETDPAEYHRIYDKIKAALSMEASRGLNPEITEIQIRALAEALQWHGERKYVHARIMMGMALEHSPHQEVRYWCARCLGNYEGNDAAASALWKAVENVRYSTETRAIAIESLFAVRGKRLDGKRLGLIPVGKPGEIDIHKVVAKIREELRRLNKE